MIKVENLFYTYPQKDLYNNISFTLEAGQHCAFIGSSGSGKSTLIDLLMNPDGYMFEGRIEITPGCRIGYVSQFSGLDQSADITVFEYIAEDFIRLQNELTAICTEMETASDIDSIMEKYQQAFDAFQAIGGDDYEHRIHAQLSLANLSKHENLCVAKLSGGEFKLIQVIRQMLTGPDLLLMDEPDVFLDFDNLNSLRSLINSHKGTMLVITHNRFLLNHCFDKIIHLENRELQEFNGGYIDYNLSLLQTKIELQELAEADTQELERNELLINKLRSQATIHTEASRGKSLKARIKISERLEARRIKAPFVELKQPKIRLTAEPLIEDAAAIKVKLYGVAFQDTLLENVSFEIQSRDKVALIGSNGTGKTTLLREIFKNNHASIEINEACKVAYLSQLQGEMLNESNTIMEEFLEAGFKMYQDISSLLFDYGFDEESLHQKIGALSGGEKTILQLAKISATNANLLLLDEPTSHLDTYSQVALEEAIKNYPGAVVMISHDFYTIVNCVDYVLMIEDKTIRKMSIRKFRKLIYNDYFDKDYLEFEDKKKSVEMKIETALKDTDYALAKVLSEELEALIIGRPH